MTQWVTKGILSGTKTVPYPAREETTKGVTPGRPESSPRQGTRTESPCPTDAIHESKDGRIVDFRHCVHCFRCTRSADQPLSWTYNYEWAETLGTMDSEWVENEKAFVHSINVLVVDAGDCGACLSELKQLSKPYYNFHRLGYFVTPTPRQADVLLVVGPITDNMRLPLLRAYEGIPSPRKVVAVGACALTGGVFGPSFVSGTGLAELIPVDVEVAGCPPPPLAILHALNTVTGHARGSSQLTRRRTEANHVGE